MILQKKYIYIFSISPKRITPSPPPTPPRPPFYDCALVTQFPPWPSGGLCTLLAFFKNKVITAPNPSEIVFEMFITDLGFTKIGCHQGFFATHLRILHFFIFVTHSLFALFRCQYHCPRCKPASQLP